MKKTTLFLTLFIAITFCIQAQHVGIKSNLLYDATTTLNLGAEIVMGKKSSFDVTVAYNPWEFSPTKRMKLWMVQPEYRYWFCESLNGHFVGLHAHAGQFNFSGIAFSNKMKNYNYQGDFYGAGLSYGYQWIINNRWGIEASIGAGYARMVYDQYPCAECGTKIKSDARNYWGPTKVGISLIYLIY